MRRFLPRNKPHTHFRQRIGMPEPLSPENADCTRCWRRGNCPIFVGRRFKPWKKLPTKCVDWIQDPTKVDVFAKAPVTEFFNSAFEHFNIDEHTNTIELPRRQDKFMKNWHEYQRKEARR